MYREDWDDRRNMDFYGKCSNPNWHGHNYELFVTVKGEPDPETGILINLKEVSTIIRERITVKLDHKNINLEVPFMKGKIASTENLVRAIWKELDPDFSALGIHLHAVKIKESENNFIEYFGE